MKKLFMNILIFILAIFMLIMGISKIIYNYNFAQNAVEVKAIVTDVELHSYSGKPSFDIYVSFEINEKVYEGKLHESFYGVVNPGDIVTVYYNPKNPNEFQGTINSIWSYLAYIILIFIGLLLILPYKKKMSFKIIDCDYAPSDLPQQLPIECSIMRTIPGTDRPDYSLAVCKTPIYYNGQTIKHLVLAPRFVGEHINKNTQKITLGVAYVTDDSLIKDKTLSFEKCKYVAVCSAVKI